MSLLKFNIWQSLNEETIAFDPKANYPDKTFGYSLGEIDSAKAVIGGTGGDWGGSMPRALWFAKIADSWGAANGKKKSLVSSQKRSRVKTASGNTSDHYKGNENAYAIDISANGESGDSLLAYIMDNFGHPEYKGGSWFNVTKDGYRYQIGWKVKDHFDHIHIGVKKIDSPDSKNTTASQVDSINTSNSSKKLTIGEVLLNNPEVVGWIKSNIPELSNSLTADKITRMIQTNPNYLNWFRDRFKLDAEGHPLSNSSQKIEVNNSDTPPMIDAALASKKIKSNYTGEKAANIDLLVNEIESRGVTNKYAIIGILSTIGKESSFIPKNEIPYTNTDNSRIRKIFGSRVKGLTDDDLNALKSNPAKFWDRVYGPDDPTGKSQQYGNTNPGDGAKYLGRGFNGITFKSGYEKYGKEIGIDLVSNPEQLNDPKIAAKAAVAFLLNGLKKKGIDPNSFTNKKDAIRAFVQVNAGAASNIEGSETLANAEKVSNNFDLA